MKTERWLFLDTGAHDAAWNMACDEALLRFVGNGERGTGNGSKNTDPRSPIPDPCALLRIYEWQQRAISIGYFQKWSPALANGRELVRRPTGGGLVEHGDGFTYSVILPRTHPLCAAPTLEIYRAVHEAVREALGAIGVKADMFTNPKHQTSSTREAPGSKLQNRCFASPCCYDLVGEGRKIAGAAIRKTKDGALVQGEVKMPRVKDERERMKASLPQAFEEEFGARFEELELSAAMEAKIRELGREKYTTEAWTRKFSTRQPQFC